MPAESTAVRVMVRVRPFNDREKTISSKKKERLRPVITVRENNCAVMDYSKDEKGFTHEREREAFEFSECFWSIPTSQIPSSNPIYTQEMVYQKSGKLAVEHAIQGFNVCIFAYGQTGSGKTHTMLGNDADPGISPRLVDDLFLASKGLQNKHPTLRIVIECMFFEIYNEKVRDLFNKKSKSGDYDAPRIRQHPTRGVMVEGLMRKEVEDAETAKRLIEKGTNERAMAETKMNAHSSRSHAIFQICITQKDPLKGTQKTSFINLVDLAGSEKISMSGVTGQALKEALNINKSLSTLRRVFDVLIENSQQKKQMVPPFRDSILTHVLSDSLGGNSKTQMIAAVSPHECNLEDSVHTLRYANQAKAIVCEAKVNEEKSAEMVEAMRDEIEKLRRMMIEGTAPAGTGDGGAGGGGGGGGAISAELKKELEEKEAEYEKMVDEQNKMEEMVSSLKQEMQEMDEARRKLDVAVAQQKTERFAAAFRNAFLISKEKHNNQKSEAELGDLRSKVTGMSSRLRALEADLLEKTQASKSLLAENDRVSQAHHDDTVSYQRRVADLESKNRTLTDLRASLEDRIDEVEAELHAVKFTYERTEEQVGRLQSDLAELAVASEREMIEKGKVKDSYVQSMYDRNDEAEALRKRKERYKQQATEERAKSMNYAKAMELFKKDRDHYMETIKAQQSLLNEKVFLLDTVQRELEDSRTREKKYRNLAEERADTIRILNESIQQYQDAGLQFMTDISHKDKEIERLRVLSHEARSIVETNSRAKSGLISANRVDPSNMNSFMGSPAIQQRSTVVRARSPRVSQPAVTPLGKQRPTVSASPFR